MPKYYDVSKFAGDVVPRPKPKVPSLGSISSMEVENIIDLEVVIPVGGCIVTAPFNASNPNGATTADPDKKLEPPGVIVLPRVMSATGESLSSLVDYEIWLSQDGYGSGCDGYLDFLNQLAVRALVLVADGDSGRFVSCVDDTIWLGTGKGGVLNLAPLPQAGKAIAAKLGAMVPRGIPLGSNYDPAPGPTSRPMLPIKPTNLTIMEDAKRQPGELYVQLLHKDTVRQSATSQAGTTLARDLALFTVAPLLFCSDLEEPDCIFIANLLDSKAHTNIGLIQDILVVAKEVKASLALLSCEDDYDPDQWAQDQALLGYWETPAGVRHAIVGCMRDNRRGAKIERYAPEIKESIEPAAVGVIDELTEAYSALNSLNAGGNLIASPPVDATTVEIFAEDDHCDLPMHPRAPYGKLIVGDPGAAYASKHGARRPDRKVWEMLQAQRVQPVVTINTDWLHVGHVDEVVSFVQAPRTCPWSKVGAKGWAMTVASFDLAFLLLHLVAQKGEAQVRPARNTDWKNNLPELSFRKDSNDWAGNLIKKCKMLYKAPHSYTFRYPYVPQLDRSVHKVQDMLDKIQNRLFTWLALDDKGADHIPVPVLFDPITFPKAKPALPNMVNMLVLGSHACIPKPWGPRVHIKAAVEVLNHVFGQMGFSEGFAAQLESLSKPLEIDQFWVPESELEVDEEEKPADVLVQAVADKFKVNSVKITGAEENVYRVEVYQPDTVDIFEAYMALRLRAVGTTAHFIDDWHNYFKEGGEVHCGTNVRRIPPKIATKDKWWLHFGAYLEARSEWAD